MLSVTPVKTVLVNGASTRYLEQGKGDGVVLLHDVPGDARMWRYSIDVLATRLRVLAPDLPGWGGSDMPRRFPYTLEALAEHVMAFLDALGIERAALAGLGLGGLIALEAALRHPERASRLVLSGIPCDSTKVPLGVNPPRSFLASQWYKRGVKGVVKRALERGLADRGNLPGDLLEGYARSLKRGRTIRGTAACCASIRKRLPSLRDDLRRLTVPTLLVWGEKDTVTPVEQAQRLAEALPQAGLHVLPHVGHYALDEMPAGFNGAVLDFLKRK